RFFVSLKGSKQGQFPGRASRGRTHSSDWRSAPALEGVQLDAATGQSSGKRQYSPSSITRRWGSALFGSISSRRRAWGRSSLPASSAQQRQGDRGDAEVYSCRLTRGQAQPRPEQLVVLGIAKRTNSRLNDRGEGCQAAEDRSRFVEPAHMGIAGRQGAI